jgi:hypothetical protein
MATPACSTLIRRIVPKSPQHVRNGDFANGTGGMRHYSTVTRLQFETLTQNPDNRGNHGRVVPFDYLPGCCGYGSPRSAFSRRGIVPAVIVVTEGIG